MKKQLKPLIQTLEHISADNLSDEFYAIAHNIEESLILAGAEPNKDYTYLDLYKLAQPFVLEKFKTNNQMDYIYPASDISYSPASK